MLRELVRNPGTQCFPLDINRVFAHLRMEEIIECVITRSAPPCNPIAIALRLSLLGLKSINARIRAGENVLAFAKWYTRKLNLLLHIDVSPQAFTPFRNALDRLYVIACQTSARLQTPDRALDSARVTRPMSLIHRDIRSRCSNSPVGTSTKRSGKTSSSSVKSPRVTREIRIGTGTPTQSSHSTSVGVVCPSVRNRPEQVFSLTKTWFFKIFIRQAGGRTHYNDLASMG